MKRMLIPCLALLLALPVASRPAIAQSDTASSTGDLEKDLELLRRDLRSEKKKLIALNVPLTEAEATRFWPVYDQYAAEMTKLYDQFYAAIKDYSQKRETLTDAQASAMIRKWSDLQVQLVQTRQRYIPIVEKVIPGRKTALFFQIDRRLHALLDLQVASQIPLAIQ